MLKDFKFKNTSFSDSYTEKSTIDYPIEDLYKGELFKSGSVKKGHCPFHEEKNPSFTIYPNNSWYCFACKRGGDVISFYMQTRRVGFREALKDLKNHEIE